MNTVPLTMMHDHDLMKLATPEAKDVLARRERGATLVRETLARMYGSPNMATASGWSIVPHVTERNTIGVVDVADGTAWDSMVKVTDDVLALGLDDDEHDPEANHPSLAAPVRFDGEVVQERGHSPEAPITAPPRWKRIGLPTWRGWHGDGYRLVPREEYEHEKQIRPRLRAVGLMTCYGRRGEPRGMLSDAHGHMNDSIRPKWVHPQVEGPRIDAIKEAIPKDIERDLRAAARRFLTAQIRHVVRGTTVENAVSTALETDDRGTVWELLKQSDDDKTAFYCAGFNVKYKHARRMLDKETLFAAHILRQFAEGSYAPGPDGTVGSRLDDLLVRAIEYVALERTRSVRDQILAVLEANAAEEGDVGYALPHILGPLVGTVMKHICAGGPSGFWDQALSILYRNGPIYLDEPAEIYRA